MEGARKSVVLAAGSHERAIAYVNNDLPGTLLAGAARTYVNRFAVRPGSRAVVFTNNDSAYRTALALHRSGIAIGAVVDARPEARRRGTLVAEARDAGLLIIAGSAIVAAHGGTRVTSVEVAPLGGAADSAKRIDCDLVCVSGGWNPAVHLFSQARGKLRFDTALATFAPDASPMPIIAAGAANARFDLAAVLTDGHAAGVSAAQRAGFATGHALAAPRADAVHTEALLPLWSVPAKDRTAKRFVDFQNDVTVNDVALAAREGYRSVEHLKRYTTLGMGTDQGKTSNIVGLALLADQLAMPIPKVGTTTFRPPYSPVTLGAFPGHEVGEHVEPTRYSPMHDWHARTVRALSTPDCGSARTRIRARASRSSMRPIAKRRNVRKNVGIVDVSTLGKIELQGRDVAELLNRIYINRWDNAAGRPLPLRRHAARRRHGVGRRHDVAPRADALPDDHDDGRTRSR